MVDYYRVGWNIDSIPHVVVFAATGSNGDGGGESAKRGIGDERAVFRSSR